jgi:acetyltransferase-like isoleucine patch superfamily enzyme
MEKNPRDYRRGIMIWYFIKGILINIGLFLLSFLPKIGKIKRLHRIVYLRKLSRTDGPAAAIEYARDCGIKVGKDCRFYCDMTLIREPYLVEIGDNVLISGDVRFITHDGGVFIFRKEITNIVGSYGKIKIGNNCFIGQDAIILPNVQIGDNCVVCAGAVVAESFPDNSVLMGNPAKVILRSEMFKKMKLTSKLTLFNDECSFPESDYLPTEKRRKFILDSIGSIPIRMPHKARKK